MRTDYLTWVKNLDKELRGRQDCCRLYDSSIHEPAETLCEEIKRTCSKEDLLREPNPWGHPGLIEAIAKKYGISDENRVLVTTGASLAIFLICRALLEKRDQVVVEDPAYQPFLAAPESIGAKVIPLKRTGDDFQVDSDELQSLVTPQTRLIILSNLHNPSSAFLTDGVLHSIAAIAHKVNAKVLVDEVFHDFVEDRQRPAATLDDTFISINGLSKVYGLSTLRCGWIIASPEVIGEIRRFQVLVENIGSRLTQAIASVVLNNASVYREHWSRVVSRNREIVREVLGPVQQLLAGDVPSDGCIFFPKVAGVKDISVFTKRLEARGVFVVPGKFFGDPARIRIGFGGKSAELRRGLEILAEEIKSVEHGHAWRD